jgi:chromosome segregation ATPase
VIFIFQEKQLFRMKRKLQEAEKGRTNCSEKVEELKKHLEPTKAELALLKEKLSQVRALLTFLAWFDWKFASF